MTVAMGTLLAQFRDFADAPAAFGSLRASIQSYQEARPGSLVGSTTVAAVIVRIAAVGRTTAAA